MSFTSKEIEGHEHNIILLFNWTGMVFQWNVRDIMTPDVQLYSIKFFWRNPEARLWWEFRWIETKQSWASLAYSHGRKGSQKSGWKIQGPLVKFVKENSI